MSTTSIIRRRRVTHAVAAMSVKTFLASATPDAIAREVDTGISPAFGEIALLATIGRLTMRFPKTAAW